MTAPLLLNLGSGPHTAEGWISIDGSWNAWLAQRPLLRALGESVGLLTGHHRDVPWPASGILCRDVRRGLPFGDGTISGIYAAHFLEHLELAEALALLRECHRVMAPGCAIRIIVPDLETLVGEYLGALRGPEKASASAHFLDTLNLAALRRWPSGWRWWPVRFLSRAGHRAVHDAQSMTALLAAAGFSGIELRRPSESRIPFLARVETPDRHEASVCLEGVR